MLRVLIPLSTTQGSIINLIRRGHPGNVVEHLESGEQFASQARAAEVFGVSASRMSKHLRGLIEDIDGEHSWGS